MNVIHICDIIAPTGWHFKEIQNWLFERDPSAQYLTSRDLTLISKTPDYISNAWVLRIFKAEYSYWPLVLSNTLTQK